MAVMPGWPAVLRAGPVTVRPPRMRDGRAWSEVRVRNERWLAPWEPTSLIPWAERHAPGAWPTLLRALRRAARSGSMLPFVVEYGGRIVGQVSVSGVVHGSIRSGSVGYWVDAAYAGRGIAPTAVALVIDHCFATVGLHRIEVDIRPENAPSLRVAAKLGLRREGYFERFLDIDGGWRDHVIFGVTVEDLAGRPLVSRLSSLPVPPG